MPWGILECAANVAAETPAQGLSTRQARPGYGWVEPAPVVIYRQPPPVVVYREAPVVVYSQSATSAAPEPIIYPRNGQSAQQTEADRQDCNRWASTQRHAMGSSGAFNRATEACMDARGYTQR